MRETHDAPPIDLHIGPLRVYLHSIFWHSQPFPSRSRFPKRPPLIEQTTTYEEDPPYRTGLGLLVRLPLSRLGLVVGYWELPVDGAVEPAYMHQQPTSATEIQSWESAAPGVPLGADTPGVDVIHVEEGDLGVVAWEGDRA